MRLHDFQLIEDVPEIQSASCRKLVDNHIKTPKLIEKIDAVNFWTNFSEFKIFPDVLDIILEILACPASSSPVERLLSLCGLRTCNRGNRTLSETLEKLVKVAFQS